MKKIIAIALLGILISSCSDKGFNKSRYGKLNWINHGFEKKAAPDEVKELSKIEDVAHTTVELKETKNESFEEITATVSQGELSSEEVVIISTKEENKDLSVRSNSSIVLNEEDNNSEAQIVSKPQTKAEKANTKEVTEDGIMLLILVILALIIPPVAVLVYEGVTSRFWLNLLFAILGGALFFVFPGLGLFALIAVVHALLIVLGVI
jgi:uncharacterized membrane protein YqaE (UPF0057 family)